MVQGWILIWRQILENPIWLEKPFSKGQAWVDLILMANHKDNPILIGNKVVVIQRGQLHTSEIKLAERWGWSRNKTRSFLTLLENQKMSTTVGTPKGTTITIENYESFQDLQTALGTTVGTLQKHQKDNEKTSKGTQTKNVKNVKNDNINPPYPLTEFSFGSEVEAAINEWLSYKAERGQSYKPRGLNTLLKKIKENVDLHGDTAVVANIDKSISNNWAGLFWDNIGAGSARQSAKMTSDILDEIIRKEQENEQIGNSDAD